MSSRWELDDGIKSIKSAWQREHTARANLEKMLENAEAENAKLRELVRAFDWCTENFDVPNNCDQCPLAQSDRLVPECEVRMRELGVEVD